MSQTHLTDELLQGHYDGELDTADSAEARVHLADCAECNERLEQLGRLSRLIRMAHSDAGEAAEAASDVDWQGMFARIERAAQEPEVQPAPAKVLQPSSVARAKWFRPAVMSAAGAIAAAAAVFLLISRGPDGAPSDATYDDEGDGQLAVLAHSEITAVDFDPNNTGAVFNISYEDGSSTPVVWIDDDDDDAVEN